MKRKCLAVGIILLFIGVAVAPSFNSTIVKTPVHMGNTTVSLTEKSKVSVQFFTLRGVETIEREISLQDSDYLSKLMDGSDTDAIASELTHLGLVPSSMNSEQLKSLINGEYNKKEIAKYSDRLTRLTAKESSEIKQNFLCLLKGESISWEARNLRAELFPFLTIPLAVLLLLLDILLQTFLPNYPTREIYGLPYLRFGPAALLALFLLAITSVIQSISDHNPIKLGLFFQDIVLYGAQVDTFGIGGAWSLTGDVDLHLVGFVGIFASFFNPHSTNEKFIGSSIYAWAQN